MCWFYMVGAINEKNLLMLPCHMKTGVTQSRNPTLGAASDPRKLTHHPAPLRLLCCWWKSCLTGCSFVNFTARWRALPQYGTRRQLMGWMRMRRTGGRRCAKCAHHAQPALCGFYMMMTETQQSGRKIFHRRVKSKHCDVTLFRKPTVSEFCNWRPRIF